MRAAASRLADEWAAADSAPDGLLAAMRAASALAPADAVAALAPWQEDPRWLAARLSRALALLCADPFARPPLRPVGGGALGGLLLAEAGAIRLTLLVGPREARGQGTAALFAPGCTRTRILAGGGADIAFHRAGVSAGEEGGAFTATGAARCETAPPRPLRTGEAFVLDGARRAFTLSGGDGDILMLELAVQPPAPLPTRTYDIASGRLTHVSASRRDSSFRGMALTLLRTMRRTDAAPLFAAEAATGDFAARWHAARELAALDPAAAHPVLARMAAADPHPEVRQAAAAALALYPTPPLQRRGSETRQLAG